MTEVLPIQINGNEFGKIENARSRTSWVWWTLILKWLLRTSTRFWFWNRSPSFNAASFQNSHIFPSRHSIIKPSPVSCPTDSINRQLDLWYHCALPARGRESLHDDTESVQNAKFHLQQSVAQVKPYCSYTDHKRRKHPTLSTSEKDIVAKVLIKSDKNWSPMSKYEMENYVTYFASTVRSHRLQSLPLKDCWLCGTFASSNFLLCIQNYIWVDGHILNSPGRKQCHIEKWKSTLMDFNKLTNKAQQQMPIKFSILSKVDSRLV